MVREEQYYFVLSEDPLRRKHKRRGDRWYTDVNQAVDDLLARLTEEKRERYSGYLERRRTELLDF